MTQGRLLGGRYQVGELLGYGGMAEVHRGRDLRLGRDVAIKTLRNDLARDATFQLRFRREAQNAAALNHPAIVAVYDTGEEHGPNGEELPFIVMEFVNGRTLKEVLAVEGRLAPRRALEILADICAALEFSHRHGIIHRDIKPGNVMLTQTGQVKVMDFGIARALASGATTMTQTSAVIGTAQYLSPEQARGESVDARSDVYATGCVLFELLCGHPPFVGDNPVSVAYQHVREDPRPPSSSNRDVTPDIDAVVLKALAKNPLNRYQSAGEMRADLMRAAAGRPVSAPPVLTEEQMTAMLTPAPPTMRQMPAPTRDVARAAQRQRRRNTTAIAVALVVLGVLAITALSIGIYLESRKTVQVPTIVGLKEPDATKLLNDNRLTWDKENSTSSGCNVGEVTKQRPEAGTQLREGSKVYYDLCVGPSQVKIPRLKGLSKDDAVSTLEDNKLKADVKTVDNPAPENQVISVSPTEGTTVTEGSTVTITVSNGKQKVVPDLTGLSAQDAAQRLREAGFKRAPVTANRVVTDPDQDDVVVGQDPEANKSASVDQQIRLFIGQYTKPSSAPPSSAASSSSASSSPGPR